MGVADTFTHTALSLIPFEKLITQMVTGLAILELFGLSITLGTVKGMSLRIFSIPSSPWPHSHCSLAERVSFTMGDFDFWFKLILSNICLAPITLSACTSPSPPV